MSSSLTWSHKPTPVWSLKSRPPLVRTAESKWFVFHSTNARLLTLWNEPNLIWVNFFAEQTLGFESVIGVIQAINAINVHGSGDLCTRLTIRLPTKRKSYRNLITSNGALIVGNNANGRIFWCAKCAENFVVLSFFWCNPTLRFCLLLRAWDGEKAVNTVNT